jgi:hypothetical protein
VNNNNDLAGMGQVIWLKKTDFEYEIREDLSETVGSSCDFDDDLPASGKVEQSGKKTVDFCPNGGLNSCGATTAKACRSVAGAKPGAYATSASTTDGGQTGKKMKQNLVDYMGAGPQAPWHAQANDFTEYTDSDGLDDCHVHDENGEDKATKFTLQRELGHGVTKAKGRYRRGHHTQTREAWLDT